MTKTLWEQNINKLQIIITDVIVTKNQYLFSAYNIHVNNVLT